MPDIPDRDELERRMARLLGGYNRREIAKLVELMENHPSLANVPAEFWNESQRELVKVLMPYSEVVYLEAAGRLLDDIPIAVDWALVNQRAADWSRNYSTFLAGQINQTSRDAVATSIRNSVAAFFEEGLTVGEIEQRLASDPDLMQLFTKDVKDRLGRVYGPRRAAMIARTEVTRAAVEGERGIAAELRREGINMVEIWETRNDERVCTICGPRHGMKEGTNWTQADGPPAHVNCRCGVRLELPKPEPA
jgi:hypothetical protein